MWRWGARPPLPLLLLLPQGLGPHPGQLRQLVMGVELLWAHPSGCCCCCYWQPFQQGPPIRLGRRPLLLLFLLRLLLPLPLPLLPLHELALLGPPELFLQLLLLLGGRSGALGWLPRQRPRHRVTRHYRSDVIAGVWLRQWCHQLQQALMMLLLLVMVVDVAFRIGLLQGRL